MATLTANLLGAAALALDGRPLKFARRSALALAVYLACAGRAQSRHAMATLLAGDSDEPKAAMALSNALRDLRALIGDHLLADTRVIALAPTLAVSSDVARFEAAASRGADGNDPAALREAVGHYGGEFAVGLAVRGAPDFDEWLQRQRARLRDQYIGALERLAQAEARAGDLQGAIASTRRVLAEEPWREELHRSLMRLLARDGQRAAALLQFERCREGLRRELHVEPQPETLALYEQLQAGPLAPPHNLPARTTPFVDRPGERALLSAQLQRPGCRLVSIVGIGGTGKTRLALEVAAPFTRPGVSDEVAFPDGVFLITYGEAERDDRAGEVASPQGLGAMIMRSLGLAGEPDAPPLGVLLGWLSTRTTLLIIDNAEVEPATAAVISAILTAAPGVRLLVTSRVRLRLEAEWVLDLGGLSVPAGPADLPSSGAGQLFLERARAARLRNPPGIGEYPHIARICQLVNGMPLAIVLAAGRLRTLSCAEIAAHVARDTALLVTDVADLPARQRNLGAVLRWSWEQLKPDEAGALRRMAVLRGDFDLAAARALCVCDLSVLDALVDYGLLSPGAAHPYCLHPLVRQLAAGELARLPDEQAQAEQRHAAHFADLAAQIVARLDNNAAAIRELTTRWSDLQAAWDWAVAQAHRGQIAQLRTGMARAWDALGLFREGIAACAEAAAALGAGQPPAALAPADATEIAEFLLTTAWLHGRLAETEHSLALMEEARAYAAPAAAAGVLARIDQQQGMQLYLQTRYRAARPLIERAVELATARGDRATALEGISVLARIAYRQGDDELMRRLVAAAERHFSDRSSALEMHYLRFAEAHLAIEHGETEPARAMLEQDQYAQAEPHHHQLNFWYWSLQTRVTAAEGRLAEAEQSLRRGLQLAEALDNGFVRVSAMILLGDIILAQGDAIDADQLFTRALRRAAAVDAPYHRCGALLGRARAAELRGEHTRAEALACEALQLAQAEAYRRLARRARMAQGHALVGLGRHAEAEVCYAQALAADRAVGHQAQATEATVALAGVRLLQGDRTGAAQLIEPCLTALLAGDLHGMEEPLRAMVGAQQQLLAGGDPRAEAMRAQARRELERRATLVTPERSQGFLHGPPAHRAILLDS